MGVMNGRTNAHSASTGEKGASLSLAPRCEEAMAFFPGQEKGASARPSELPNREMRAFTRGVSRRYPGLSLSEIAPKDLSRHRRDEDERRGWGRGGKRRIRFPNVRLEEDEIAGASI